MDPLSIGLGVVAGVAVGVVATYFVLRPRGEGPKPEIPLRETGPPARSKVVLKPELDKARKELKPLLLEKELMSGALTRVYEAEAEGKLTKEEREQLSAKYREQLKSVNQKIGDIDALIEVGELENLRDTLVSLFEEKLGQLESRLAQAKVKLEQLRGPLLAPSLAEEVAKVAGKKAERMKPRAEETEADRRVKALKDEVLAALERLEQIDIEG